MTRLYWLSLPVKVHALGSREVKRTDSAVLPFEIIPYSGYGEYVNLQSLHARHSLLVAILGQQCKE